MHATKARQVLTTRTRDALTATKIVMTKLEDCHDDKDYMICL